jgi:RimJ/RimL family protein N-acetyltransferase
MVNMASAVFSQSIRLQTGCLCLLRRAEANDRNVIIRNICAVSAERRYLPVYAYVPTPVWEAALDDVEGNGLTHVLVVAEVGGAVIGHARLFPGGYGHADCHVGDIGMALLQDYRGLGIGAHLLDLLTDWAAGVTYKKLTASIISSNQRALRLFLSHGFVVEGRRSRQFCLDGLYVDEVLVGRLL